MSTNQGSSRAAESSENNSRKIKIDKRSRRESRSSFLPSGSHGPVRHLLMRAQALLARDEEGGESSLSRVSVNGLREAALRFLKEASLSGHREDSFGLTVPASISRGSTKSNASRLTRKEWDERQKAKEERRSADSDFMNRRRF